MRLTHRESKWIRSSLIFLASAILAAAAPGPAKAGQEDLSRLPIGAQGAISGTLGRSDPSYHATLAPAGFRASSEKHGLRMDFGPKGLSVASGPDRVDLAFRGIGYGENLRTVAGVAPTARANRVEYRRGSVTEWYINGPLGLEQGFTLNAPPPRGDGPLTLALSISGTLDATLDDAGRELVLACNGTPALRYRGLMAIDSAGRELPARLELAGATLLLRVDDSGARYPVVIDPFIHKATLVIANPEGNDHFGYSVAIDGETIVVGANRPPQPENTPAAAYVFVKPASGWSGWSGTLTESAELNASDEAVGDWFGASVDIDGDTIVVGAIFNTVALNQDQGAAYVFVKPTNGWAGTLTENAKLSASDGSASDNFGSPVVVGGDTVVVGVPSDDTGGNNQGSAYVFVEPPNGWAGALTEDAKLTASDGSANDQFGHSVDVSGDAVVAGALGDGPGAPATAMGSVYVFVKPVNGWAGALTQNAKLTASDGVDLDALGTSVAVGGDTVFAGASGNLFGKEGSAYVFVKPVNGWSGALTESAKLIASDAVPDNHLGALVALSGDTVLVGAAAHGLSSEAAYLYAKPVAGWAGTLTETEKVTAVGCCTVAFAGKTIVVGDEFSEQALVFERPYTIVELLAKLLGKIFNSGSTIPVKFGLTDADGVPLTDEEAERLSSSCSVQVFFTGGDPSPNCATRHGHRFQFNLKTSRDLPPGTYTITVKVFAEGVEAGSDSEEVRIR